jgi:hypothetical protein
VLLPLELLVRSIGEATERLTSRVSHPLSAAIT